MTTIRITDIDGKRPSFTQWDVNRVIHVSGISEKPMLHFENRELTRSLVVEPEASGNEWASAIPNFLLLFPWPFQLTLFVQDTQTQSGEGVAVYRQTFPIVPRKKPQDFTYEENIGYINWVNKSEEVQALIDDITARLVRGDFKGEKGDPFTYDDFTPQQLADIKGEDGVSPDVTFADITNGHRMTVTDKTHPTGQSIDILNGENANLNDVFGVVGSGTYTFTAKHTIHTGIQLTANHSYVIRCETETESLIYAFAHGDTDVYAKMHGRCEVPFLSPLTAELDIHNVRTYIGDVKITVLDAELAEAKLAEVPTVYRVGAHEAYSSFTALCLALKDDDTEKIIELDGGDYDIFQEYVDLGLMDGDPPENPTTGFWDYVVKIPTNTHVIGKGNVRLLWQPTTAQISIPWSKTVGPVCIGGSMTLENVEIRCKNGRYCIHDDTMGKAKYFGSVKRYINVRCYKEENDSGYGFLSCIGFGLDANCSYEFEDCVFSDLSGSAFYMHTRTKDDHDNLYGKVRSPRVLVEDCVIDAGSDENNAVKLGNVDSRRLDIETMFAGCAFHGTFDLRDETTATGNNYNSFEVTLLNCSDVTVVDRYGEANDYPVQVHNWPDLTGYATQAWVQQQEYGTYSKPSGGIPKSDLASAVQTSLGKADTALQSVPNTYRTAAAQDVIDAGKADADLGVTGATVGQYVKIKTVDGVGNPTSFEPGTPSGGGADVPLSVVSGKICITFEVST